MIVVSDTSILFALVTVRQVRLLSLLYGRVIVTPTVAAELSRLVLLRFDEAALAEAVRPLDVVSPKDEDAVERLRMEVDAGEASAMVLAQELGADFLLIDEFKGRRLAKLLRIPIKGFAGLLLDAKSVG